jgi:hypothetical protein
VLAIMASELPPDTSSTTERGIVIEPLTSTAAILAAVQRDPRLASFHHIAAKFAGGIPQDDILELIDATLALGERTEAET